LSTRDNQTIKKARELYESGKADLMDLAPMLGVTSKTGALKVMRKLGPIEKGKIEKPAIDIERLLVKLMSDERIKSWSGLIKAAGYDLHRKEEIIEMVRKHKKENLVLVTFRKRLSLIGKESFKKSVIGLALRLGYVPSAKEFDYSRLYDYFESAKEFWDEIGLTPNRRGRDPEPLPSKFKAAHFRKNK
jgi:hypothetical protein